VTERVLDALAQRSPELLALIWAVWYSGRKLDHFGKVVGPKIEKLTEAIGELKSQIAVLLDRGQRVL